MRQALSDYLDLARARPELFSTPGPGVRVLLDPEDIAAVEGQSIEAYRHRGESPEAALVGLLVKDPWVYVLRDAVEFPDGHRATYTRVINRYDNGAAALPLYRGKIVLIRHFRHPLRKSILEIPRGAIEAGDTPAEAVKRELLEEIGAHAVRVEPLGFLFGSTSLYGSGSHLFFAEIENLGVPQLAEGVQAIEEYTVDEFEGLLLRGDIVDSFTVAAFSHSRLRKFL
jgi:ADP-ribose pyrophosphatase